MSNNKCVGTQLHSGKVYSGITINKNRVKLYNVNNVESAYLDSKTEFELELCNNTPKSKMCKISMNGSLISDKHLVLRPGERVFLDCNPVTNRKFIFDTYIIDKSSSGLISDNGLIVVEWYDEQIYEYTHTYYPIIIYPKYTIYPKYPPYYPYYPSTTPWTYCNTITNQCSANSYFSNSLHKSDQDQNIPEKQMETGRIEQGKQSNQNFDDIYTQFNSFYSYRTVLKILPKSRFTINEVRKYCKSCGKKVKQNWIACPICGNNV